MTDVPAAIVSHQQLQQKVSARLRADILNGVYRPGEWLRQKKLAQQLGVSQMPVREALKELAAEGLVEHLPYRGVRVIAYAPDEIADIYLHRAFLEGLAARTAAGIITPEELRQLAQLLAEMRQNRAPEQLAVYRQLNRRFHESVFTASRRGYLIRVLKQMWDTLPTMLWSNFAQTASQSLPERDLRDEREHAAILDALTAGDGAAAEEAMRRHIENAGIQLITALQNTPTQP
ncbi:MAG: GntR family transcriptional regulator [Ardenticatenales bacterium]|nr:GntR family transcriptional regulator [Ardenticatenales bacterium]